jgi:hypothetical protein
MTAARSTQWATKYVELLENYVALLGGDSISPAKKARAEVIATLSTELVMLTNKFAIAGRGASPEDLNLYLKLSGNVAELLMGAGLQQTAADQNQGGDDARIKLAAALNNLIRGHQQDEAAGIFRDASGSVITDPARLVLERWIYTLKGMRDNPPPIDAAPPSPAFERVDANPTAAPPANVVDLKAARAAPETHRRAPEPVASAAPITAEKSTTQKFLDWSAAGGNGDSWSAGPSWPRG